MAFALFMHTAHCRTHSLMTKPQTSPSFCNPYLKEENLCSEWYVT